MSEISYDENEAPPERALSPEEEEWLSHPHTRFVADHMNEQANGILLSLIDACQAPDASPRCAGLAAQYVWLVRTAASMRGKS